MPPDFRRTIDKFVTAESALSSLRAEYVNLHREYANLLPGAGKYSVYICDSQNRALLHNNDTFALTGGLVTIFMRAEATSGGVKILVPSGDRWLEVCYEANGTVQND